MFLQRNKKNIHNLWLKKAPYLELCLGYGAKHIVLCMTLAHEEGIQQVGLNAGYDRVTKKSVPNFNLLSYALDPRGQE